MAICFDDDLNPDERVENKKHKWQPGQEPQWEPGNALSNLIQIQRLKWNGKSKQRTFLEITVAHGQHIGRRAHIMLIMDAETRFILKAGMEMGLVAKLQTEEFDR